MMRVSLYLTPSLHNRLHIVSKQAGQSVSALARELLDQALAAREKAQLKRLYEGIDCLDGIGPKGITDASTTIDQIMYGE